MSDAVTRLESYYNGDAYNEATNPGGLDNNGHKENFIPALRDVATVGAQVANNASLATAAADRQQSWGPIFGTTAGTVTYLNAAQARIGSTATDFAQGRHVQADLGTDGIIFGLVTAVNVGSTTTTVSFSWFNGAAGLTANLVSLTTIDESRMVYLVDLDTPVAVAQQAATDAESARDSALSSKTSAATSASAAATSAASAAASAGNNVRGMNADLAPDNARLGLLAYVDATWLFPPAKTWTAGSIATMTQVSTTMTASGADIGDFVIVSCGSDLQGMSLRGVVTAQDTVTLYLFNPTAGTLTIASASYNATVIKLIPRR